jgi:uncharacterized SAM-binding protein YcdF (DUF218 family)
MKENQLKKKKRTKFLILFFILLIFCYPIILGCIIYQTGLRDECNPSDIIIVLGAAHYNGKPSPVQLGRLEHAVALYKAGFAQKILFTGGKKRGDIDTEAETAKKYAINNGIPIESIFTENTGLTTVQSMQNSLEIMHKCNISSAIVVSDPFHMYRLKRIAKDIGMKSYLSPTAFSRIISLDQNLKYITREIVVYSIYRLTGI